MIFSTAAVGINYRIAAKISSSIAWRISSRWLSGVNFTKRNASFDEEKWLEFAPFLAEIDA
jgi:hypothetical protein